VKIEITGLHDVMTMLRDVAPKEARKMIGDTVNDVAKQVAKAAQGRMPVDTGAMRKGVKVYREKMNGTAITSTIRVVGAYYWRFLEYGDGPDGVEHGFFFRSREEVVSELDRVFLDKFARRLVARLMQ
jgi:hypothetical protein